MRIVQYISCLGVLLFTSCTKELLVGDAPDFDAALAAASYQVGEEVVFNLTGNADVIAFYSGEVANDYAFRDGRIVALDDQGATMAFTSGVTGGAQENQLSIWVSTDFDGNYESIESVRAANWTEVTNRFALGTSATFLASGTVDLSDLIEAGKPLYIGFRYVTRPQAENGLSRNWMIQTFTLTSNTQFNDANVLITDQARAGFTIVDEDPENTPVRSQITATRVSLLGNVYKDPSDPIYNPANPIYDPENPIYDPESPEYLPGAEPPEFVPYDPESPYNDPLREHWAISRPLYTDKVDLGPDLSLPVKGIRNDAVTEYRHVYKQAGTYRAYFIASNTTIDDAKEVIREVTVTITE
ncbi:DUF5017 domain-containing protein [Parapedobacter sp. GCM10030251]|uniref:DUF5017 domain-containing protein n=1 Tax=Parapedobacter sp. GCM10030251 TaxID=3273419 RepID=UPI00360615B2